MDGKVDTLLFARAMEPREAVEVKEPKMLRVDIERCCGGRRVGIR